MKINQNTLVSIQNYILDKYKTNDFKPFGLLLTNSYNNYNIYKLIYNHLILDKSDYVSLWNASIYCYFEMIKPDIVYLDELDVIVKNNIGLIQNRILDIEDKISLRELTERFMYDIEQVKKCFWKPEIYLLLICGLIQEKLENEN